MILKIVIMALTISHTLCSVETTVPYQPPVPAGYDLMLEILTPSLSALRDHDEIISPLDRYKTVLTILKQGSITRNIIEKAVLNATTISDLGLLFYDVSKPSFTVLKKINRTKTTLGECSLGYLLITPTVDINLLQDRQNIIRFLVQDDEARTMLQNVIRTFADQEDQLLALWNKNDLMYSKNMNQSLFSNNLRKKQSAARFEVTRRFHDFFEPASPFIGLGMATFIGRLVTKDKSDGSFDALKAFFKYVPPAMTALGAAIAWKTAYSKLKNRRLLVMALKKRFHSLVKLGEALLNLGAFARKYETFNVPALNAIKTFSGTQNDDIHTFFDSLTSHSFSEERGYLTAFLGPLLAAVPQFLTIKDRLCNALHALGELDALLSIATLIKEHEPIINRYCYAEYVAHSPAPLLEIDQFWHPNLPAASAVPNDIKLGGDEPRNMIITGSNAGGKSTNTKAMMLAILFAQTITVAAAQKIILTPFTLLNTYLNIVEDAGNAVSQHRAEVRRAHELITQIQELPADQFSITVMDEMFRCTNPATGAAAAYGIGKELGTLKNSFLLLATHYFHLTKLANEPDSSFANWSVAAIKNEDGSFTYPYKLEPGINATVIALDLLKREGFDEQILEYAYEHLQRVESQEAMSDFADALREKVKP